MFENFIKIPLCKFYSPKESKFYLNLVGTEHLVWGDALFHEVNITRLLLKAFTTVCDYTGNVKTHLK